MAIKKSKKKPALKKSKAAAKARVRKGLKSGSALKKSRVGKTALKKAGPRGSAPRKLRAKVVAKKTPPRKNRGKAENTGVIAYDDSALRAQTGGQSGDTQGLSGVADAESESVKELLEEGQSFEAEVVQGVESVPDADEGEVRTHEVPEDDVPDEYLGKNGQN
ncbi:MAG: hypothetical protein WAK20_05665 [Candidatus Acidiferrum sp.]